MKAAVNLLDFLARKVLSMLLTLALVGLVASQAMHDDALVEVFAYAAGSFFLLLFVALVTLTYIRTKYLGESTRD